MCLGIKTDKFFFSAPGFRYLCPLFFSVFKMCMMNRFLATTYLFVSVLISAFGAVPSFSVPDSDVVFEDVSASTGLSGVVVLRDASSARMIVPAGADVAVFGKSGAAYSEPVQIQDGEVALSGDDCGYVISSGGETTYYWIVNYANHTFRDGTLTEDPDLTDCSRVAFAFSGNADEIRYYSVNGRGFVLSREMTLEYDVLEYSESAGTYVQVRKNETLASVGQTLFAPASGCRTDYTLSPDRFARRWNIGQSVVSDYIPARLVDAVVKVEQNERDADNEKNPDAALGGSAPVDISFSAVVTDAAVFHEWQFSQYPEFDDIDRRFTELSFEYSFTEAGTTYCRFVAADAAGKCEYYSETFEVFVGESKLECPNAFSPYGSPGINDLWKVSYQSIISFECHIFNRWGKQICSFNEPSQGWDGKFKGKLVPAGVYYYVIKAKGADGRSYNLSGDINLIKAKDSGRTSSGDE